MVMMFVGGDVLMLDRFFESYGAGVFCSCPNPYSGKAVKTALPLVAHICASL
jgi:hypothetical protein